MSNKPITELDFFQIKDQLRQYLKTQTKFKDYNFEGSNLAVLLDVLSYNTYQNNFYTNMAISEMFLDSAQRENSVVSHAKELNYLPRSAKSAMAIIDITIKNSSETSNVIAIPKGSRFTTAYQGTNYVFYTKQTYIANRFQGDLFKACCVEIHEGELITEGYIYNSNAKSYVLINENVDISSITVTSDDDTVEYIFKTDIFGVKPTDPVFYLEPSFDSLYAVTFGRNQFGRTPAENNDIKIRYQISSGSAPNGASKFSSSAFGNSTITVQMPASGGAEKESLSSIKFFAPKAVQIQERAVTASDYEVLLKQRFPEIQAISVLGGDELDPPQYGRVGISIKLFNETSVSENLVSKFKKYISDKTPLSITPVFIQPKFNYLTLTVKVEYSTNLSNKSTQELEALVRAAIANFTDVNLNDFQRTFRISRLSGIINDLDDGILSNAITAMPIIEYSPTPLRKENPVFAFDAKLNKPYPYRSREGLISFNPAVKSSIFKYENQNAVIMDDGAGGIMVVDSDVSKNQIIALNIGTIDYETGRIALSEFGVDSYDGRAINIIADTFDADIISPKNTILTIRDKDVYINFSENR